MTAAAALTAIFHLLQAHLAATGVTGGLLFIALVSSLPEERPRTIDDWYRYFRESLQTAIPAARRHPQNPTQDNSN